VCHEGHAAPNDQNTRLRLPRPNIGKDMRRASKDPHNDIDKRASGKPAFLIYPCDNLLEEVRIE